MHTLLLRDIPATLRALTPEPAPFKFEGSDGHGLVTDVPWVAVFHRNITSSAKTGYYVVWLLPADRNSLVLELGLGATQFADVYGENKKALAAAARAGSKVLSIARPIAQQVFSPGLLARTTEGELPPLGTKHEHKAYGKGAILSVTYSANDLPSDDRLKSDYQQFMALYERLAASVLMPSTEDLAVEEFADAATSGQIESRILEERQFEVRPSKVGSPKTIGSSASARYSKASKKIGDIGERLVFEYLKKRLMDAGQKALSEQVVWHQEAAADRTPGWDITAFDPNTCQKIFVEVKASQGSVINDVILTRNEWVAAQKHGPDYFLYLVTDAMKPNPKLEVIQDPADYHRQGLFHVEEASWKIAFQCQPRV